MTKQEQLVKDRLEHIAKRGRMFAQCREALVALISGMLEVVCDDTFEPQKFYAKNLGIRGNTYTGLIEQVTDEWAKTVAEDALTYLPKE